ncbi:MAG: glucosamine-6-phosphate deaminase [Planctomycetota bacterium]
MDRRAFAACPPPRNPHPQVTHLIETTPRPIAEANHDRAARRPDPAAGNERAAVSIHADPADASVYVAGQIARLIRDKAERGETAVLGLATGSTPVSVYNELIRLHREEGLSFANVVTFNLDEYFPMEPDALQSYVRFMREHLFDHVDIPPENCRVPDGTLSVEEVPAYCEAYERAITEASGGGGIDLQILGIGRTGHIGFNEPGSGKGSRTRLIWLDRLTRLDAASDFFGIEHVPTRAITMGVGTILAAKRVILMAWGEGKAPIVARAVEGEVTDTVAASFLQEHRDAEFVLDDAAAAQLTRLACPWRLGPVHWDAPLIRKAVIWLARQTGKPLLKLTDEDYNEHHLQSLVAEHGPGYQINLDVFRSMQSSITGWPGGKPPQNKRPGDIRRTTDDVFPKRCLVFSPHPDDDVISMGGTLIRLVDQGHDVHVAYQVSGSIAVFDDDAIRFADFAAEFNRLFGIDDAKTREVEDHIEQFLKQKNPGQVDSDKVQLIKGVIRRGEARAAGRYCGVPDEHLHFLDMPFYETGTVRKKPLGEDDVEIITRLLREVKPHQIYAAGDLSDPHGTHRTCLAAIFEACRRLKDEDWFSRTEVWLYRGAWQEWEPEQIEMAVPISPEELQRKRVAIFKHESQKDKALFPGVDEREFWQRAEDRNRATAKLYDELGLAEYEAIEGFVRWTPEASEHPKADK